MNYNIHKDALTQNILNLLEIKDLPKEDLTIQLKQEINIYTNKIFRNVPRKKRALLVGLNYIGTQYQLNGCINDVVNIGNKLINSYGFKKNDIVILSDNTRIKPTKTNILNELKKILLMSNLGDTLVFYYSGHGTNTIDLNGDEKDGKDEVIIPLDMNLIKDDELNNLIKANIKDGVNFIGIFDSCFSGSILDLRYQYLDSMNNNNLTIEQNQSITKGKIVCISGCQDNQTSEEIIKSGKFCGALTWCFLETINTNPSISWSNLVVNMRDLMKTNGYTQIPQISSSYPLNINVSFGF